jgi:hypothetical protein
MADVEEMKELCECGCQKGWHSLSSQEWLPSKSGCLSGSRCGCTKFKAKLPADASPSEPQDACEGGKCWLNPESGWLEACTKHEGVFMDKMMEKEAAPTAAGSEEPKPLKFNLENPGEMIAASGAVKALHDAGYRAAPVASQAPAPKRPEAIKDAGLGKKYWAHEADAYMDYQEGLAKRLYVALNAMKMYADEEHKGLKIADDVLREYEANHE